MAYISGTLNQNARVIVLDSNYNTLYSDKKNSGAFKADKFGDTLTNTTESGIVVAVNNIGETLVYHNVEFAKETDLPRIPYTETFDGVGGAWPTNWHLWSRTNNTDVYLNNGKLRVSVPSGSPLKRNVCRSKFLLLGNFDIQVDIDAVNWPTTSFWSVMFEIRFEPCIIGINNAATDYFNLRRKAGNFIDAAWRIGGNDSNSGAINTSITSTKFRIIRQNNLVSGYYWNGSSWVTVVSNVNFANANAGGHAPVSVDIGMWNDINYPAASTDFDNFIINSGHVLYKYLESFVGYSNGSSPDPNFFDSTTGLVSIQGEKLRLSTSSTVSLSRTIFKYPLVGNFNLISEFAMTSAPNSGVWGCQMSVKIDDNNYIAILRRYDGSTNYITGVSYVNGSSSLNNTTAYNGGYFRLGRTGTTVYAYFSSSGENWTQVHTRSSFSGNNAYLIFSVFYTSGTPTVSGDFDKINIINKSINDTKIKWPLDNIE